MGQCKIHELPPVNKPALWRAVASQTILLVQDLAFIPGSREISCATTKKLIPTVPGACI